LYESSQRCCTLCCDRYKKKETDKSLEEPSKNENKRNDNKESNVEGKTDEECPWSLLENSLQLRIISFLPWRDALRCALVSRKFKELCSDESLWRHYYISRWNVSPSIQLSLPWKALYQEKHIIMSQKDCSSSRKTISPRTINEISKKLDVEVDGRIVILGASGVGKTALLQYMNGESIDTSYPSRESIHYFKNIDLDGKFVKLHILATSGEGQFWPLAPLYYNVADVVLIMYSITEKESFEIAKNWYTELSVKGPDSLKCALAGCKEDMRVLREVLEEDLHSFAVEKDIPVCMEISCKTGKNIEKLFSSICRYSLGK